MSLSLWALVPAVVLPPLLLNLRRWRLDLKRIHTLTVSPRQSVPSLDAVPGQAPRVSFLLPAWNAESTLQACVEAVLRLPYPDFEVVLCAGGTDRTWQIASQFRDPRLILLEQRPGEGKQKSLRRCLERASGDIIYLLDADCLITSAAFARILAPILSHNELVVTSRPYAPFPEQLNLPFVVSQTASQVYAGLYQPGYNSGLWGGNCALTRAALEQAGGFDNDLRIGTDVDLGKRLARRGIRIRREVEAPFPTKLHTEVRAYLRQQSRHLRNQVIHGCHYGAWRQAFHCLCTSLVGFAMLAVPCLALLLAFLQGQPSLVVRLSVALWALAFLHFLFSRLRFLGVANVWRGIQISWRVFALLPVFLLIDFLAWALPLAQYPFRSFRESW